MEGVTYVANHLFIISSLDFVPVCLLQDHEIDEDVKFLIQYRSVEENSKRNKNGIS